MNTETMAREHTMPVLKHLLGECRIIFCFVRHASRTGRHSIVSAIVAGRDEAFDDLTVVSMVLARAIGLEYQDDRKGFIVNGEVETVMYEKIRVLSRQLYGRDAALGVRWL